MEKEYKLPREFGEKWVKALRSGEYKQTTGYMHKNNAYCCLGVACVIVGNDLSNNSSDLEVSYISDILGINNVPKELEENNKLQKYLAGLNDEEGKSFKEIADWIEDNIEFYDKV